MADLLCQHFHSPGSPGLRQALRQLRESRTPRIGTGLWLGPAAYSSCGGACPGAPSKAPKTARGAKTGPSASKPSTGSSSP